MYIFIFCFTFGEHTNVVNHLLISFFPIHTNKLRLTIVSNADVKDAEVYNFMKREKLVVG